MSLFLSVRFAPLLRPRRRRLHPGPVEVVADGGDEQQRFPRLGLLGHVRLHHLRHAVHAVALRRAAALAPVADDEEVIVAALASVGADVQMVVAVVVVHLPRRAWDPRRVRVVGIVAVARAERHRAAAVALEEAGVAARGLDRNPVALRRLRAGLLAGLQREDAVGGALGALEVDGAFWGGKGGGRAGTGVKKERERYSCTSYPLSNQTYEEKVRGRAQYCLPWSS